MSADTPSAILGRAADLIRDTGKAAKSGPWSLYDRGVCWEIPELPEMHDGLSGFREVDARWIALLSPDKAEHIEAILRDAASSAAHHVPIWQNSSSAGHAAPKRTDAEVASLVEHHYGHALALARVILGEEVIEDVR